MNIGNYELHHVETGTFGLDGGAMFGVVPKVLWNRTNPGDEKNRIELSMRGLLVVGEGKVILIDTGVGDYWPEKFNNIYAINQTQSALESSLTKLGFTAEDVTDVVLTHLHFDHVGGAVKKIGEDFIPRFPKATYYVQKDNLQHAQNPLEKDKASYLPQTFLPLLQNNKLKCVEGEKEIFKNFIVYPINGHTVGQQIVKIYDTENTLLYCADLIPTSSHIPIPYVMSYDLFPVQTIEEKKKYLQLAADDNWLLYFEHDPKIAMASIKKESTNFSISKTFLSDENF